MSCHQYEIRPRDDERDSERTKLVISEYHAVGSIDFRRAPYMKYVNTYCENDCV